MWDLPFIQLPTPDILGKIQNISKEDMDHKLHLLVILNKNNNNLTIHEVII